MATELTELKKEINFMKTEITNLKVCMAGVKKDLEYLKIASQELNDTMKDFIKSCEKKYAPIWVATVLKMVMSVIGVTIIGAVLALILK